MIINARVSEILELVYYEIKSSGLEKKLVGGIVLQVVAHYLKRNAIS